MGSIFSALKAWFQSLLPPSAAQKYDVKVRRPIHDTEPASNCIGWHTPLFLAATLFSIAGKEYKARPAPSQSITRWALQKLHVGDRYVCSCSTHPAGRSSAALWIRMMEVSTR